MPALYQGCVDQVKTSPFYTQGQEALKKLRENVPQGVNLQQYCTVSLPLEFGK